MGLIGVLVVTTAPSGTSELGTAYPAGCCHCSGSAIPAVQYNAEVPLEFSEIDPVQNKAVDQAVRTAGFSETDGVVRFADRRQVRRSGCGNPASALYQHVLSPGGELHAVLFPHQRACVRQDQSGELAVRGYGWRRCVPVTTGISATGTVLVRMVNAGLRMHVPSIVGSQTTGFNGAGASATVRGFTLIAEDGNPIPD